MTKNKVIAILISVFIIHLLLAVVDAKLGKRPMAKIGELEQWNLKEMFSNSDKKIEVVNKNNSEEEKPFEFFTINKISFSVTWFLILCLVIFAKKATKNIKMIPGRLQAMAELVVEGFDDLTRATLGPKKSRPYLALILTLFVFICTANWIGIVPSVWKIIDKEIVMDMSKPAGEGHFAHIDLEKHKQIKKMCDEYNLDVEKQKASDPSKKSLKTLLFPKYVEQVYNKKYNTNYKVEYKGFLPDWVVFEEPTQDLNTTLGLGLLVFIIVIYSALKKHGMGGVYKELASPFLLMLPMNIIGEIGKLVSHSFRLFGNIKGGAIIMIVISYLISNVFLPIGLYGFFGIFVGTIQAFVFAMLALVYVSVWITEDEEAEENENKSMSVKEKA